MWKSIPESGSVPREKNKWGDVNSHRGVMHRQSEQSLAVYGGVINAGEEKAPKRSQWNLLGKGGVIQHSRERVGESEWKFHGAYYNWPHKF